ncbi:MULTISPECIES: hypothetical protein [Sinorhizobium]|uniref:Uncharacterized protein n=1 Tax=Sinorhizobium americanum TaxID=194963 RepID=A0A2S3YJ10_9HYPH|nr:MULTISPECIES: hypothetical protein [Sinorhizobium]PDT41155.1 hypothetical protein CO656_14175 [Sinorhizobium sp. FG01]PDT51752.1 hypothetical protein CO664_18015 [Sinorhizobium sp. NG07B]POH26982.1 hypothetical protein ATY31_23930 [Sinorhizobium americanum]POH27074.1 hypothetical protein ATY30_22535 [Sinorhizobium americanum]
MDRKAFYEECSRILGASHAYEAPRYREVNRWNNRRPGNGRFPGYGLIRASGPHHIQIALRQPVELNLLCHSEGEALAALERTARQAGPEAT